MSKQRDTRPPSGMFDPIFLFGFLVGLAGGLVVEQPAKYYFVGAGFGLMMGTLLRQIFQDWWDDRNAMAEECGDE